MRHLTSERLSLVSRRLAVVSGEYTLALQALKPKMNYEGPIIDYTLYFNIQHNVMRLETHTRSTTVLLLYLLRTTYYAKVGFRENLGRL